MKLGMPLALAALALAGALTVAGAALIFPPAGFILAGIELGAFVLIAGDV